jgi:hypothetical protein
MSRPTNINEEIVAQAMHLRDNARSLQDYRAALSVILRHRCGLTSEETADVLGTSPRTVFRDHDRVAHPDEPRERWGGRRHCVMSMEQEKEFLAQWEAPAAEGGVLSVPPIHAALVKRLGRDGPISTTYRMLARHGWRKIQPDTKHPKSDPAVQEEYKKNSPKRWRPPA